jgi:hypothetical protein
MMPGVTPDLDRWLADPALRVTHRRSSTASPDELWEAAREVRLRDVGALGRLVRLRIPGLESEARFDEVFRCSPFMVLRSADRMLISGLVGKIWTLRRDYPSLDEPDEFRSWSTPGTVRVLFANWVEPVVSGDGAALVSEARIAATDMRGRLGLAAVRPLVAASEHLIASEGIRAAVRLAERRYRRG